MADESQNALLKTLEEPAAFVHLILISSEPGALLETVRSRCQPVRFAPLGDEAVEAAAGRARTGRERAERRAAARLAAGDPDRAAFLVTDEGRGFARGARRASPRALGGELGEAPWAGLLEAAEAAGSRAPRRRPSGCDAGRRPSEGSGPAARAGAKPRKAARRVARRARTEALDLGLALIAAWLRDLAAVAEGAEDLLLNVDRAEELAADAEGLDARRARRGGRAGDGHPPAPPGQRRRGARARGAGVSPGSPVSARLDSSHRERHDGDRAASGGAADAATVRRPPLPDARRSRRSR